MDYVSFENRTPRRLFVAYAYHWNDCNWQCGDPWRVEGWCVLEAYEKKWRQNPTGAKWFYYYAEALGGGVWAGTYPMQVTKAKFDTCSCSDHSSEPSSWYTAWMRELDTSQYGGVLFFD